MCLTAFIFKSHCHIMTDKVVARHTSVVETTYEAGTQFSTSLQIVGKEFFVKIVPKRGYLIVVLEKTSLGTSSVRTQTYTVKDGIESKKNQKNFRIKENECHQLLSMMNSPEEKLTIAVQLELTEYNSYDITHAQFNSKWFQNLTSEQQREGPPFETRPRQGKSEALP